ncbi:MAG: hypothetical protein IKP86_07640 [Anaerolineaceae bacterium]|nr:hypothetical protein [Anaerolineaceae bacterium]
MKKYVLITLLLAILVISGSAMAFPGYYEQLDLIAAHTDQWRQGVDYGTWGYIVTDLDQNGRLEIISASVQGTGFYTYLTVFEVNEAGNGLNELAGPSDNRTDSAPDVMVSRVPVWYDRENNRYYYIFDDMIRNGMAEYYENKRSVSIVDGKWIETMLAVKSTLYQDEEHYTTSCQDGSGNPINESQYNNIAQSVYGGLESSEACFNWQMTDNDTFAALTGAQLTDSLKAAADAACH